ncbi:MAG: four helix bundle protein [Deltaproteobacteria bacterium]|nr:four helix bundle protein [Deltaproteobacteria bacterium]
MLSQFRAYQLAVSFHHACRQTQMPDYLKDQINRASSSIALNLAEGSGRATARDQLKFFHIALGSLRESQAALDLAPKSYPVLLKQADLLGAHLYRLCHQKQKR